MSRFNDYIFKNYDEYIISNKDISNLKLSELECKHILLKTEDTKIFVDLAEKVDYKWVVFGSHRGLDEKDRVQFEINRINEMIKSTTSRAVRIVRTSNDKYFADNTHWILAYLKRIGDNAKLSDIPFYLVDFCHEKPIIVDVKNSVIKNHEDMKNAVNAAGDVEERIEYGWRPNGISYTIKQFEEEISQYEEFIKKNFDFNKNNKCDCEIKI